MSDYEFHPACLSLPKMDRDEYSALRASIRAGYDDLHPILLHDGLILDGRHRYLACIDENVTPKFHNWSGEDPFDFVRREHEARRSWRSQEQKALVIGTLLDRSEEWAAEKARIQEEANRARSAARAEQATPNPDGLGGKSGKTADDAGLLVEPHCEVQPTKPIRDIAKMHKQSASTAKAQKIGVSRPAVERAETIKRNSPALAEKVAQGEITAKAAIREIKAEKGKRDLAAAQKQISTQKCKKIESVCELRVCSCADLFESGIKPDAVITDPPYPKEFLPLFSELAEGCKKSNVPLVAVMSGQSYLPEVMRRLCEHLRYRWTLAYMTPGGQAVQQWQAKVNTAWKPVLFFGDAVEWFGDVAVSKPNDNDKRFHNWGQSESGMADLVGRLTKPGQLVCDPFLGGGTTAVVSLALGRRFIGCDIDASHVEQAKVRVMEA